MCCYNDCITLKVNVKDEKIVCISFVHEARGKYSFIAQTTVCKSNNAKENSRKKFNYSYFLLKGAKSYRICKCLYLATLAISQKMVYNVHQKKDKSTGVLSKAR